MEGANKPLHLQLGPRQGLTLLHLDFHNDIPAGTSYGHPIGVFRQGGRLSKRCGWGRGVLEGSPKGWGGEGHQGICGGYGRGGERGKRAKEGKEERRRGMEEGKGGRKKRRRRGIEEGGRDEGGMEGGGRN